MTAILRDIDTTRKQDITNIPTDPNSSGSGPKRCHLRQTLAIYPKSGLLAGGPRYIYIYSVTLDVTSGGLVAHAPLGLQLIWHRMLREDGIARQTADSSGTVANGSQLRRRDTAAVAAYRARLAAVVTFPELPWGSEREVQARKRARLLEGVSEGHRQRNCQDHHLRL